MPLERRDYTERFPKREYDEIPENPEDKELPDETEKTRIEKELHDEVERIAEKAAREFDEAEARRKEMEDIAERVAKILDELERENEVDKKETFGDELDHDLDEVRDELHDEYENDMNRHIEAVSGKDIEREEGSAEDSSSETTEYSESYKDSGTGMVYALETKSESECDANSEVESEVEDETQEHPESSEPMDEVEKSPDEQVRNQITRQNTPETEQEEYSSFETEEAEEKHEIQRSESNEPSEFTEPEVSKSETSPERQSKLENQESGECPTDDGLDSVEESDESVVQSGLEYSPEKELSPDASVENEESELDEAEHEIEPIDDSGVKSTNETESQEMSDDFQTNIESPEREVEESEESELDETSEQEFSEAEDLPEELEVFVRRVQDLLNEIGTDDGYDYVQDPLTGEMQRVHRILSEYESEKQRRKRKLRNLFAELSEEERERFKEITREMEESEDKSFAEHVERLWTKVVEKAEEQRREFLDFSNELSDTLEKVLRFHSTQNMSEREVAKIVGISRNQVRKALRDVEVHHRYFSEGQTFHQIATELDLTIKILRGIFMKHGWKMRIQKERERLSNADIRRLHHEEGMTFVQISQYSGLDMPTIREIIGPRKSKTMSEEIGRLYFQEGYSYEMISDILGVSMKTIRRTFEKNNWYYQDSRSSKKQLDPDWVYHLYFIEGFSQNEVADILRVHTATIQKLFNDQGWPSRDVKEREQIDIDEKRRKYQRKRRKKLKETRIEIFGNRCYACQTENTSRKSLHLHRKDGTEHDRNLFRSLKKLKSLKSNEWTPLCDRCHLGVHMLMSVYGYDWTKIEAFLKARSKESIKPKGVLELPNESTPLSKQAQKIGLYVTKKQLKKALFGETCSLCSCDGEDNPLILHRKDGMTHKPEMTQRKKYLQKLNPDEWALVCPDCHNIAQWALDKLGIEWSRLSRMLKQK